MLKVSITTIERTVFRSEEISKVKAPTVEGYITILPKHASLTSSLGTGEVVVTPKEGKPEIFFVDKGVLQVHNNVVEILADLAERSTELDEAKIEEAKRRAQELLNEKPIDVDIAQLESSLKRELQKSKLVKKWRNNGHDINK